LTCWLAFIDPKTFQNGHPTLHPKNIYVVGEFEAQERWNDLLSRLTWYFTPFLDQIGTINICARKEQLDAATNAANMDPLIADHLETFRKKSAWFRQNSSTTTLAASTESATFSCWPTSLLPKITKG
jgi:hypothetical protein